jgi:hypothetical protein
VAFRTSMALPIRDRCAPGIDVLHGRGVTCFARSNRHVTVGFLDSRHRLSNIRIRQTGVCGGLRSDASLHPVLRRVRVKGRYPKI